MSTTQETLAATPPTTELPPEKDKSGTSSREYVVLEQRAKDGPWVIVKRVTAADADSARTSLGDEASPTAAYVAVADRYWQPKSPKVETQTIVTWQ